MHPGSGPGLTSRRLGETSGVENVTLHINQMPAHNHTAHGQAGCNPANGNSQDPVGNFWAKDALGSTATYHSGGGGQMAPNSVAVTVDNNGGNQPHTNIQPFQCVNFIIALVGTYPSRS